MGDTQPFSMTCLLSETVHFQPCASTDFLVGETLPQIECYVASSSFRHTWVLTVSCRQGQSVVSRVKGYRWEIFWRSTQPGW